LLMILVVNVRHEERNPELEGKKKVRKTDRSKSHKDYRNSIDVRKVASVAQHKTTNI